MFYKGIKRFFVLVGVFVLASVVFAGCKDDKTTKLTSIGFKETEAITLVLGNTYQPQVVLTPSYADNLDYYFETSSNSNVITIINKSIKAVGEGVAQLKVVSAENSNLNDIISVKVIPETIKLSAPKNLTFNGSSYSFDYQTMAEKYIVNVNGVAFDIGTRNSLSLEEIAVSVPNVYNTVLSAKVQAVGDGNITETSQFSEELKVLKIG